MAACGRGIQLALRQEYNSKVDVRMEKIWLERDSLASLKQTLDFEQEMKNAKILK